MPGLPEKRHNKLGHPCCFELNGETVNSLDFSAERRLAFLSLFWDSSSLSRIFRTTNQLPDPQNPNCRVCLKNGTKNSGIPAIPQSARETVTAWISMQKKGWRCFPCFVVVHIRARSFSNGTKLPEPQNTKCPACLKTGTQNSGIHAVLNSTGKRLTAWISMQKEGWRSFPCFGIVHLLA